MIGERRAHLLTARWCCAVGRTALHWAAAVNNVDAVVVLVGRDANKDAQDSCDETPLLVAAREGSGEAVRALLDAGANRDLPDHMDRLPRDVAVERLHHDIAHLLDSSSSTARRYRSTPAATDGVLLQADCLLNKGKHRKGLYRLLSSFRIDGTPTPSTLNPPNSGTPGLILPTF